MILRIALLLFIFTNQGCNQAFDKNHISENDTGMISNEIKATATTDEHVIKNKSPNKNKCFLVKDKYTWIADVDEKGKDYLIKGGKLDKIKNDYNKIIDNFNELYNPLKININKVINDTIYINIENSPIFTQQMGDTEASIYKVTLIYSLTENKKLRVVMLNFQEGDHGGSSGYFVRTDFIKNYYVINCNM